MVSQMFSSLSVLHVSAVHKIQAKLCTLKIVQYLAKTLRNISENGSRTWRLTSV